MGVPFKCTNTVHELHKKPIFCVAFNHCDLNNKDLFVTVAGNQATIYRCKPRGAIEVVQVYTDADVEEDYFACQWSIHEATGAPLVLIAGKQAIIRVIDCSSQTVVESFKGHGKDVHDIAVHPQRPHLFLTASKDHSIRLWNILTRCCVLLMKGEGGHNNEVISVDFHPWDPCLFLSSSMDTTVKIWSLKELWSTVQLSDTWADSKKTFPTRILSHCLFSSPQVHGDYVDCVRWLGDLVLSKSVDNRILLWRPQYPADQLLQTSSKFDLLQEFQLMHANMWWVRFSLSLSGDVLACGNGQGKMYVWNPNEMNAAAKAVLGTKACTRVVRQTAVSLDGDIIVSSCEDGTVWRWDATAGGSGTSASLGGRAATPSLGLSNGGGRVSQQVSGPGSNGYGRVSTPDTSTGRMQQQQKQQQQQQQHKRRKQQTADGNDTEDNTGDNDGVQEQQQQQQLGRQPAVADQDDEESDATDDDDNEEEQRVDISSSDDDDDGAGNAMDVDFDVAEHRQKPTPHNQQGKSRGAIQSTAFVSQAQQLKAIGKQNRESQNGTAAEKRDVLPAHKRGGGTDVHSSKSGRSALTSAGRGGQAGSSRQGGLHSPQHAVKKVPGRPQSFKGVGVSGGSGSNKPGGRGVAIGKQQQPLARIATLLSQTLRAGGRHQDDTPADHTSEDDDDNDDDEEEEQEGVEILNQPTPDAVGGDDNDDDDDDDDDNDDDDDDNDDDEEEVIDLTQD